MSDTITASLGLSTAGLPASAEPASDNNFSNSSIHPAVEAPPGPAPLSDSQGTYVDVSA